MSLSKELQQLELALAESVGALCETFDGQEKADFSAFVAFVAKHLASRSELADVLKVSQATLSRWIGGDTVPSSKVRSRAIRDIGALLDAHGKRTPATPEVGKAEFQHAVERLLGFLVDAGISEDIVAERLRVGVATLNAWRSGDAFPASGVRAAVLKQLRNMARAANPWFPSSDFPQHPRSASPGPGQESLIALLCNYIAERPRRPYSLRQGDNEFRAAMHSVPVGKEPTLFELDWLSEEELSPTPIDPLRLWVRSAAGSNLRAAFFRQVQHAQRAPNVSPDV